MSKTLSKKSFRFTDDDANIIGYDGSSTTEGPFFSGAALLIFGFPCCATRMLRHRTAHVVGKAFDRLASYLKLGSVR